jgi:hypothetical protein
MTPSEHLAEATKGMSLDQRAELYTLMLGQIWNRLNDDEWNEIIDSKARLVRFAYAKPQPLKGY